MTIFEKIIRFFKPSLKTHSAEDKPTSAVAGGDKPNPKQRSNVTSTPRTAVSTVPRPKRRLLKFMDLKALADVIEMIKGLFTSHSMIVLYGASGSLKSFLAMDISLSIASGKKWAGLHEVDPGHVLYVLGEGGYGTYQRVAAWMKHHDLDEMPDLMNFDNTEIDLFNSEDVAVFINDIKHLYKSEKDAPLQMIVFDTLARTASGADENSNRDMGLVVKQVNRIQRELNCSVVLVHHTGKHSHHERGASCIRGAADTMLHAEKTSRGNVTLTVSKQKDREEGQVYEFEAETIKVDDDKDSLVLRCTDFSSDNGKCASSNKPNMAEMDQNFIIEALSGAPEGLGKDDATNDFLGHFSASRGASSPINRESAMKAFRRARDVLVGNETIVILDDGTLQISPKNAA